jgi:hypothetical protein
MHLLESESDIIQPVEISYKLLTGDISSVKMSTVDILLGSHQVLHANISSTRVAEECTMAYTSVSGSPTHLSLLLSKNHSRIDRSKRHRLHPDAMFDEDLGDEVTDHMLNTSVRDHVFRIRACTMVTWMDITRLMTEHFSNLLNFFYLRDRNIFSYYCGLCIFRMETVCQDRFQCHLQGAHHACA